MASKKRTDGSGKTERIYVKWGLKELKKKAELLDDTREALQNPSDGWVYRPMATLIVYLTHLPTTSAIGGASITKISPGIPLKKDQG